MNVFILSTSPVMDRRRAIHIPMLTVAVRWFLDFFLITTNVFVVIQEAPQLWILQS